MKGATTKPFILEDKDAGKRGCHLEVDNNDIHQLKHREIYAEHLKGDLIQGGHVYLVVYQDEGADEDEGHAGLNGPLRVGRGGSLEWGLQPRIKHVDERRICETSQGEVDHNVRNQSNTLGR